MVGPSIREVLTAHIPNSDRISELETALIEREDAMADYLRLAGAKFGMYPEIVAAVLADIDIGTPLTEEARDLIRAQFIALMQRLQEENGQ